MGETGLGRGASAAGRSRGMLMSSCTDCEVSLLRRKTCTHANSVRLQNLKIQKYFTGVYPRKIQISRPARILVIPYPESTGTRIYLDILGCKIYGVQIWIVLTLVASVDQKYLETSKISCVI